MALRIAINQGKGERAGKRSILGKVNAETLSRYSGDIVAVILLCHRACTKLPGNGELKLIFGDQRTAREIDRIYT